MKGDTQSLSEREAYLTEMIEAAGREMAWLQARLADVQEQKRELRPELADEAEQSVLIRPEATDIHILDGFTI